MVSVLPKLLHRSDHRGGRISRPQSIRNQFIGRIVIERLRDVVEAVRCGASLQEGVIVSCI